MVTETPAICGGSGAVGALSVAVVKFEPKMLSTVPGAYDCWKEAPFERLVMAGGPAAARSVALAPVS